jgi:hypothetical protein
MRARTLAEFVGEKQMNPTSGPHTPASVPTRGETDRGAQTATGQLGQGVSETRFTRQRMGLGGRTRRGKNGGMGRAD